jgi:predicted nucleic acid-binding protein
MLYLDTSLIVAVFSNEVGSAPLRQWLVGQPPDDLAISDWTTTEVSSALAIKIRTGRITVDQRALALAAFNQFARENVAVFAIVGDHFRAAARIADQHRQGVRAGDALHIAVASSHGATICTRDQQLAEAGPALGVPTQLF